MEFGLEDIEYMKWIWEDSSVTLLKALGIYAVALGAYWTLVA